MFKRNETTTLFLMVLCAAAALFGSAVVLSFAPTWMERWQRELNPVPSSGMATLSQKVMPDFKLTDQNGNEFRLSQLQGRPVFIFFGFTYCPDVCPVTISDFKRVSQSLASQADDVAFVMISIDPDRDTPEVLQRYVSAFDKRFWGLTGTVEQLENVTRDYGASFRKQKFDPSETGYSMAHTSFAYLLDKHGRWRFTYPFGAAAKDMTRGVQQLLSEK